MRAVTLPFAVGLAALLWAVPLFAAAPNPILLEADRIRATERDRFDLLLNQLQKAESTLTLPERQHLRLLQGYRRVVRGDHVAAIADLDRLFEEAIEPSTKFRAGLLIANSAALTRDFVTGLRYLDSAMALRNRVSGEARDYGDEVAGTMFNQFGQHSLALEHANTLLARDIPPRAQCVAKHIRLHARYSLDGSVDEAEAQEAIAGCAAQREKIAIGLIRVTLARYWAKQGQRDKAISLLESSMADVEATRFAHLLAEYHGLLAELRLSQADIDGASAHARRVTSLGQGGIASLAAVTAHGVLYKIALQRGDLEAALKHYQDYAQADKSYLDDVRAREYAFHLTRHELRQKNQSIELLESQNQLLRLQQEVALKEQSNSRLLIALLMVVASSLGYWGWRARRLHHTLRQLAQTDSLTGLANRRHFRAQTEALLVDVRERGRPLSVLLFDLDHFKQINDRCGHAVGDWVLKEVARVGRLLRRPGDVLGRIGGEEFAMTLVDCDLGDAELIAERMREAIAAIDGRAHGCPLPVSASIGCVATSVSGHDYETLVAHADAAMYRSKVGGRNRISRYQTASITPVPVRIEAVPVAQAEKAMRVS